MKKISRYIDLGFCLVVLPVMVMMLPIERWFAHFHTYVLLMGAWLYILYFLNRIVTVHYLFEKGRKMGIGLCIVAASIGITYAFSAYPLYTPQPNILDAGCIAIDDEPIALSILREHSLQYGDICLKCFTSPSEGWECILQERPDLVFLDIELTSHNGLELARKLPSDTTLIFTTAYAEYALEGYNVNAIDFLHKPIFYPRFMQAMDKARRWMETSKNKEKEPDKSTIVLKAEHKKVVVDINTVTYIEAMDNYVKIYRNGLPMVVSQITMKDMQDILPSEQFMRVHRSYIVRLGAIDHYTSSQISIRDCRKTIPIGRTYAEHVKNTVRDGFSQL